MSAAPWAAQNQAMRLRTRILAGLLAICCFGVLLVRLYILQIRDHNFYARRAAGQQLRDTVVPAPRGEIISADGTVLASSATCWTIRASPREMADEHVAPASAALAQILELDEADLLEMLKDRASNDKLLCRRVGRDMADAVRDWCAENGVDGILIQEDTRRYYPEGDFAASVLGFTNVDNAGMAGLELEYNTLLTGQNGRVLTAKNAWGYDMPTRYGAYVQPVRGCTLHLTIDSNIQHFLENHLLFAVQEHHVSARAIGIVMDVNTGAILAISTKPDYDPNQPRLIADETVRAAVDALEGEERRAALQLAQQTQWRNKAVSDLYEPGSVFKLITCSAALDTGVVTPQSTFVCGASYSVAGTHFHCANNKRHGLQTVAQAVQNSCNQSFIQIGQLLGKEAFCQYFEAFGLCAATGIDLPAEPPKSEFYTADRMGPVELASCAFGQSSKITPIQMITAVAAIVNGGRLMQPYIVGSAVDASGREVWKTEPKMRRQVISEETSAQMRQMMELVVADGSGRNAYVAGYRVGGKTGTSQKLDSEDEKARIASFIGVAPIDAPRIAVLIALDEPHSFATGGGALAAPVAAQIIDDTLQYLGVTKTYTPEEQQRLETAVPELTGWKTEAAAAQLAQSGLAVQIEGQGERVLAQTPQAGHVLPRASTVLLYTEEGGRQKTTEVPALAGQSYAEARQSLVSAGLNLAASGALASQDAVAVEQDIPPGESLPMGSVVKVRFYETMVENDD